MAVTEALEGGAAGDAFGHSTEHNVILCPKKMSWEGGVDRDRRIEPGLFLKE
jgi:hypothetical protein